MKRKSEKKAFKNTELFVLRGKSRNVSGKGKFISKITYKGWKYLLGKGIVRETIF